MKLVLNMMDTSCLSRFESGAEQFGSPLASDSTQQDSRHTQKFLETVSVRKHAQRAPRASRGATLLGEFFQLRLDALDQLAHSIKTEIKVEPGCGKELGQRLRPTQAQRLDIGINRGRFTLFE